MTSGEQYAMITGAALMLLWFVSSWGMRTLEVSASLLKLSEYLCKLICNCALFVGGIAYSNARFGAGTGPIFLDDVQCSSSSSQLLECSSSPILTQNCQHSDDAGVGCEGMLKWYTVPLVWKCTFITDVCV